MLTETISIATHKKATGSHYTPSNLAHFVASQIKAVYDGSLRELKILDPAVGDGELLMKLVAALGTEHQMSLQLHGFDINADAIGNSKQKFSETYPTLSVNLQEFDFLELIAGLQADLFRNDHLNEIPKSYDIVIANPPYVRTQVLGAKQSQRLSSLFGLKGRLDLYHAFLFGIAKILKPGGLAGIIVSNRFMTTKSGALVRRRLLDEFDILHIWDFGDTQLFDAAVLPAVLLLRKKGGDSQHNKPLFSSMYSVPQPEFETSSQDVISAFDESGMVRVNDNSKVYLVKHGTLDHDKSKDAVWRVSTIASDAWLAQVDKFSHYRFGDIGKIRVGVKTTADKVFLRCDWDDIPDGERPELLRPAMTHHGARRFRALNLEKPWQLLYTHEVVDGKRKAVDLKNFPKSLNYLSQHQSVLTSRKYIRDSGRHWFEIWVPQDPSSWKRPKLVFRDISEQPMFWLDLDGSIVNGDCYWLALSSPDPDNNMLWLALAVANSSFIEEFYDHRFNNKLYSGRRRFMSQYVENFPIPEPHSALANQIVWLTKQLYDHIADSDTHSLEVDISNLVWQSFGFSGKEATR